MVLANRGVTRWATGEGRMGRYRTWQSRRGRRLYHGSAALGSEPVIANYHFKSERNDKSLESKNDSADICIQLHTIYFDILSRMRFVMVPISKYKFKVNSYSFHT